MTYQITTPIVQESIDAARSAIMGLQNGSLEPRHASVIVGAARTLQSAVSTDIKARIAAPKIAAQEAKLIEAEQAARQITTN